MKTRAKYTEQEYKEELRCLWREMLSVVYLKKLSEYDFIGDTDKAWMHTDMTPLQYIVWIANPSKFTNQILRGQKARELRWKKWIKEKTNEN